MRLILDYHPLFVNQSFTGIQGTYIQKYNRKSQSNSEKDPDQSIRTVRNSSYLVQIMNHLKVTDSWLELLISNLYQ